MQNFFNTENLRFLVENESNITKAISHFIPNVTGITFIAIDDYSIISISTDGFILNFENDLTISFTLDHRIPKSCGGSDDLFNLWLMCSQCNFVKSHYKIPYLNIKDIKKEYFEIKKTNHKLAGDFLEKERQKYFSWI